MLKAFVYVTINTCDPEEKWFRVHLTVPEWMILLTLKLVSVVSYILYMFPLGPYEIAFDCEIAAICKTLLQIQTYSEHFLKVVFPIGFQSSPLRY